MKKEIFRTAIRNKLIEVPLEIRQSWNETDLLGWWGKAKSEDSYLMWDQATGDVWQHVKSMCQDLIGTKAV